MATQTVEATDHKLLAAGEWRATGEWAEVKSPYDGTVVGRVAQADEALAERAIEAAHAAFSEADFPQHKRAAVLERAAELVAERRDELAATIAAEAGKPIKTATVEAERCVSTLEFSAVEARKLTGGTVPMDAATAGVGKLGVMLRVPYGVVGAISPFNFPAQPRRPQARAGDRRRQRGRPQARRPDADLGPEAGRDPGRGRPARELALGRARTRLQGRQRDRRAPADQGDHLHRLGPGRLGHPLQGPAQEGQPRARLQRAADRQRTTATGKRPRTKPRSMPSPTPARAASRSSGSSSTRPSPRSSPRGSSPTSRS